MSFTPYTPDTPYTPPPPPVNPPPKRGIGFGRILLISCGVVVFACCACVGVIGAVFASAIPAIQPVTSMITAASNGDYKEASSFFTPDLLERLGGKNEFTSGLKQLGLDNIDNWTPNSFNFTDNSGYISGPAKVSGTTKTFRVELKKVGDKWMISDLKLTAE